MVDLDSPLYAQYQPLNPENFSPEKGNVVYLLFSQLDRLNFLFSLGVLGCHNDFENRCLLRARSSCLRSVESYVGNALSLEYYSKTKDIFERMSHHREFKDYPRGGRITKIFLIDENPDAYASFCSEWHDLLMAEMRHLGLLIPLHESFELEKEKEKEDASES